MLGNIRHESRIAVVNPTKSHAIYQRERRSGTIYRYRWFVGRHDRSSQDRGRSQRCRAKESSPPDGPRHLSTLCAVSMAAGMARTRARSPHPPAHRAAVVLAGSIPNNRFATTTAPYTSMCAGSASRAGTSNMSCCSRGWRHRVEPPAPIVLVERWLAVLVLDEHRHVGEQGDPHRLRTRGQPARLPTG
jgi:hypothetical protein